MNGGSNSVPVHTLDGSYGPYDHIWHLWGRREERNSKRARKNIRVYARREPIDAMRQLGEKVASTLVRGWGVYGE